MSKPINKAAKVRMLLRRNPNTKAGAVVELLDCSTQQAHVLLNTQRKAMEIYRQADGTFKSVTKTPPPSEIVNIVETHFPITMEESPLDTVNPECANPDPVNHPWHYKVGGIETIDFIEAKNLGYNLGNVVKYITRADHKGNKLQDLQKAQWYLNREIAKAQA
jgi:hypothetical protein